MIPYTDHECRLKLNELLEGLCVVIPANLEHATLMLEVAQKYIKKHKKEMWVTLQTS